MQLKLGVWKRPHGKDDILVQMGNSHEDIWGNHGQARESKGSEVEVNLACLNDKRLWPEKSQGRGARVIRDEVRKVT